MRQFYTIAFFGVFCILQSNAQELLQHDWALRYISSNGSINAIAYDMDDNLWTFGGFSGTIDLDPGPNSDEVTVSTFSVFFSKLTNNGNYLLGGYVAGGSIYAKAIASDQDNNIFFAGHYNNSIDFSSLVNGASATYNSAGNSDIFIAKCNPNGELLWAKSIGGVGPDQITSLTINTQGELLLTGSFTQTVDFDPNLAVEENLTAMGNMDAFVACYSTSGELVWVKQIMGPSVEIGMDITVDINDNIYVVGSYSQTVDFDPDPNVVNQIPSNGGQDIFLLKLNEDGIYQWAFGFGSGGYETGLGITVDSNGDLIYTGTFSGTVDFDSGSTSNFLTAGSSEDLVVSKISAAGDFQWAVRTLSNDFVYPSSITVDESGHVFISGLFNGIIDFNPDGNTFNMDSGVDDHIFACKWAPNGQFQWAAQVEGTYYGEALSIKAPSNDELYIAGSFNGIADFDPNGTIDEINSGSESQACLFKWNSCPDKPQVSINIETLSCTSTDVNYTWLNCDNNYSVIAGETNQTFTPTANGNYAVMVDNGFCADTSECVVIDFISVDELDQMKISIAPNPTNSNVTVYFNSVAKNAVVEVYDALGQLIGVQQTKHSQQQTIQLPKAKGVYFVHVSIDDTPAIVQKVIKH